MLKPIYAQNKGRNYFFAEKQVLFKFKDIIKYLYFTNFLIQIHIVIKS